MNKNYYYDEVVTDAKDMVRYFSDEIVEQIMDSDEASTDLLNDYPHADEYHHQTHVDKDYLLAEAVELLEQLDQYEETDSGLWEGLPPKKVISAMAAYTYGNAVYWKWNELIKEINEQASEVIEQFEGADPEGVEEQKRAKLVEVVEAVCE
jgi:hypothetical protein